MQHTAPQCNTMHTWVHPRHVLLEEATYCNTLQHTATHCNTLQHTATHCNTLQRITTHGDPTAQHPHTTNDEARPNQPEYLASTHGTILHDVQMNARTDDDSVIIQHYMREREEALNLKLPKIMSPFIIENLLIQHDICVHIARNPEWTELRLFMENAKHIILTLNYTRDNA